MPRIDKPGLNSGDLAVLIGMTSYLQLHDSRLGFCVIKNGGVAEKAITAIEAIKLVPLSALTTATRTEVDALILTPLKRSQKDGEPGYLISSRCGTVDLMTDNPHLQVLIHGSAVNHGPYPCPLPVAAALPSFSQRIAVPLVLSIA